MRRLWRCASALVGPDEAGATVGGETEATRGDRAEGESPLEPRLDELELLPSAVSKSSFHELLNEAARELESSLLLVLVGTRGWARLEASLREEAFLLAATEMLEALRPCTCLSAAFAAVGGFPCELSP